MLNQGKVSGEQQRSSADLPLLYVRTGGELMNEMHGYTEPVDGGYYRDTLTPVGESKTINLSMDTYGHNISSVSFELYNDQYTDLIESGDCTDMEKVYGSNAAPIQKHTVFQQGVLSASDAEKRSGSGLSLLYKSPLRIGSEGS